MNTNAEPRAATRGRKWSSRSNRLLLAGIVAALAALSLVAQVADGSKAVGTVVDKVTPDLTAIPWVLLSAKTTPGADGDRLVDTTFIQRLYTTGGLQPAAADCNAATAGTVVESPYTAEYVF